MQVDVKKKKSKSKTTVTISLSKKEAEALKGLLGHTCGAGTVDFFPLYDDLDTAGIKDGATRFNTMGIHDFAVIETDHA